MDKNYKYSIKGKKLPVILMAIMTILFGALTIWTYNTDNSVSIMLFVISLLMLIVFLFTVHRLLFYKLLIGLDGFYYQTHFGNGKFYPYEKVDKAWTSSGKTQKGVEEHYCNISLEDKRMIRIPFQFSDEKGINYLVKKVNSNIYSSKLNQSERNNVYEINGKTFGKSKIFWLLLFLAIIAFSDILIVKEFGFIIIPSIIVGTLAILYVFNYYLCFIVRIEKDGFYYRTTPFNGHYYKYSQVKDCRIVKKVIKHHRHDEIDSVDKSYYFFFVFNDIAGKKHTFQFEEQIYENEINILKERINAAHK